MTSARVFACSAKTASLRSARRTLDGKRADRDVTASVADRLAMAVLRRNADPSIRIASYPLARFNRSEPQSNGREILNLGEALPQLPDLVGTTDDILRRSLAPPEPREVGASCPRLGMLRARTGRRTDCERHTQPADWATLCTETARRGRSLWPSREGRRSRTGGE